MNKRRRIRKINFQIAQEERRKFADKLSPLERLEYLQHLRVINLGETANNEFEKILSIIKDELIIR